MELSIVLWGCGVALGAQSAAPPTESAPAVSADQIAHWVADLNSDQFIQREQATERLIEAGLPAIQPLVVALSEHNLEVTARSIFILRELALTDDPAVEDAARAALAQVAQNRGTTAARRASSTLEMLAQIRQQRAIEQLQAQGARFETRYAQLGFQVVPRLYSVEIGTSWRGTDEDLKHLRWLDDIEQVVLEGQQVNDAWLASVAEMKSLISVELKRGSISDKGVAALLKSDKLRYLSFKYVPINDASIDHLLAMKDVSLFRLIGTELSAEGVQKLRAGVPEGAQVDVRAGAFLGVGCEQLAQGCTVSLVHPSSAAARAGMTEGDVIVKYNGNDVSDFEGLTKLISKNRGGDTITLLINRSGQILTKKITLGEWD
jgi:hypothetical protein